jgi:hypothetical protein
MRDQSDVLSEEITRLLLRYFRGGCSAAVEGRARLTAEDVEFLRLHWALSTDIRDLASRLRTRSHETQALLQQARRTGGGYARGRVLAAETLLQRCRSGNSGDVVSLEPSRNLDHGLNRLVVWTLRRAMDDAERFCRTVPSSSALFGPLSDLRRDLVAAGRLSAISHMFHALRLSDIPSPRDVASASRHRIELYRLAAKAVNTLRNLERLDASTVRRIVAGTLIGPMEDWRRFELLVLLKAGEAISAAIDEPLHLNLITPESSQRPIGRCGHLDLYWQHRTDHFVEREPDPGERLVQELLSAFGLGQGADRPDVVVVNRRLGRVVGVLEAKYSASSEGSRESQFRDAVGQLVRYSRCYAGNVLPKSLVCMVSLPSDVEAGRPNDQCPFAIDMPSMLDSGLADWATSITKYTAADSGQV